jgi:predicted homoserine dehydrogenase-like protein
MKSLHRIGIVGTGFIARGLVIALEYEKSLQISKVLTRRSLPDVKDAPRPELLTNSAVELIESSDLLVECSGDVLYATEVIDQALEASLPVITMNAELQVTTGSYLASRGFLTEAEGDQPGSLAALRENMLRMGFTPHVYGNIKGFLQHNPSYEDMVYWSKRGGISLGMVTSFTDGTKVQIEQALVANGLGARIAKQGLLGPASENLQAGAELLAGEAEKLGAPISDYVLSRTAPPGVFIAGKHDERQAAALAYYKLGPGPYYTLVQPYHLCHLEIIKTIYRVIEGRGVLLNNSLSPSVSVAALAKRALQPGERIHKGIGSFEVRGVAIEMASVPNHIPIGLLAQAVIRRSVEPGQIIQFDDVEIPDSLALQAWQHIKNNTK